VAVTQGSVAALIQSLAWEPPYATGAALKKKEKEREREATSSLLGKDLT